MKKCKCVSWIQGVKYERIGTGNCNTCDQVAVKPKPLTQVAVKPKPLTQVDEGED